MAIDKNSLEHLEDSLVHDEEDEEREMRPQGTGIYMTPRFLGGLTVIAYAVMIPMVLVGGKLYPGDSLPIVLMPGSLLVALPMAIIGLYLYMTGSPEPLLEKQRTMFGRLVTGVATYVGLQVLTAVVSIGLAMIFEIH